MSATVGSHQRGQGWAVSVPRWGLPTLKKRRVRRWPPNSWIQMRPITPPIENPSRSIGCPGPKLLAMH